MNNRIYKVDGFCSDNDVIGLQETIFHNANGYIGVRGTFEEGLPDNMDTMRGTYINGVYDMVPMKQAEKLYGLVEDKEAIVNVADTQTIKVFFGNEEFSSFRGKTENYVRILDMEKGCTIRSFRWVSPEGKMIEFVIRRMTSFHTRQLFTIDYEIRSVDYDGDVSVKSFHKGIAHNYCNPNDPRMAAESGEYVIKDSGRITDGYSVLVSRTATSNIHIASAVGHEVYRNKNGNENRERVQASVEYDQNLHEALWKSGIQIHAGESVRIIKYCVFADDRRFKDPARSAEDILKCVIQDGIAHAYRQQTGILSNFWNRAGLQVKGNDELNASVQFNMYSLLESAGTDGISSIPAKGLSGEGYEGHCFWDTEIFMLPFFDLTDPAVAQAVLKYRYNTLPEARENAKMLGHKKGVLFPWRTITGRECSGYFVSGTAAYHINGDIAYAVIQYYIATGDMAFIREYGFELLLETARLWMDVGNFASGRFHINCVTGPDEYTCMINNNYFTNAGARYNLEWVGRLAEILEQDSKQWNRICEHLKVTQDELCEMKRAADKILLPYDEALGINPQDDSFLQKPIWNLQETEAEKFPLLLHYHPLHLYRYQVCKQADTVLSYFLYPQYQEKEIMEQSYLYYEKITTHDSSLSTCVFSIVAAMLGMYDKAVEYMGNSAMLDLYNTHNNSRDGIHAANMGGCYMAIVNGLGRLCLYEKYIALAPFLPDEWDGYSFRFMWHGKLFEVNVSRENGTTLTMLKNSMEDEAADVEFYGNMVKLACGMQISSQQNV